MKDFKSFGVELAQEAGEIMRANFTLGMKREWKKDNTPLTISDTTINSLVIKSVKENYPTHGVLGEEESYKENSEYTWVCDPIDGTIPFSHGIPISTFSLALTQNGVSIFGVIYDPFMDRLFAAEKGKGAFLNDNKITVSSNTEIKNSLVEVEGRSPLINLFRNELVKKGAKVLTFASFAYAGMLVAAGELIAAVYPHINPWDAAAVKIVVEEAGGKCTDLNGNDQLYNEKINGLIASNGIVHEQLVELLGEAPLKQ